MEQILELHEHEDIHSIRDRLEHAQTDRALLVIPPYSDVLKKRVELQLIQRFAQQKHVEMALVTHDMQQRALAAELGIPTFLTVEAGQSRQRWRRPVDDSFGPYRPPDRSEAHQAAQDRDARIAPSPLRDRIWPGVKAALILIVAVAIVVSVVAVLPSAEVYLVPQSERVVTNVSIVADAGIEAVDVAGGHVPATRYVTDVKGEIMIPTSGRKFIPTSRATGVVFFVNQLNIPFRVQKGTVVRTSAGAQAIRFVVTSDVEIPGGIGAQAQAPIEAVEVGAQGSVPPNFINEIEGVAALSLRVSNPDATKGGGDREVSAVDPQDLVTAREQLLEQMRQQALDQLAAENLDETEFLLNSSLSIEEILDATYDKEVTEQATELTLQMRARFSGLAVDGEDANAIVYEAMRNQAPIGYDLLADGLVFQRGAEEPAGDTGQYRFEMQGTGYASADLDVGGAIEAIAGKPAEVAAEILQSSLPLQKPPRITVSPSWFPVVPLMPVRVRTIVDVSG